MVSPSSLASPGSTVSQRVIRRDQLAPFGRVVLRDQPVDRHLARTPGRRRSSRDPRRRASSPRRTGARARCCRTPIFEKSKPSRMLSICSVGDALPVRRQLPDVVRRGSWSRPARPIRRCARRDPRRTGSRPAPSCSRRSCARSRPCRTRRDRPSAIVCERVREIRVLPDLALAPARGRSIVNCSVKPGNFARRGTDSCQ